LSQKSQFFAEFFGENIFQIITSVIAKSSQTLKKEFLGGGKVSIRKSRSTSG
jgi:hypothetical protein